MVIGILQTDKVRPELAPAFGEYPAMFISLFKRVAAPFQYIIYDITQNAFPASPDECDAFLITGSRYGAYDDLPWIHRLMDFIRECYASNKPMVGICFGHQILAHALGGRTEKSPKGFGVGVRNITVCKQKPWMRPFQKDISLLYSHQDQVVALPPAADLLGGDAFCPNSLFSIGQTILGIQGHPEFVPAYEKAIMDLRLPLIGQERYEKAVSSLKMATDEWVVGQWMVNFLMG